MKKQRSKEVARNSIKIMPPLDGVFDDIHDRLDRLELLYGYLADSLGVDRGKLILRVNK